MAARVTNLTFHGVGPPPRPLGPGEARVWLGEDDFLAVLDAVAARPDVRLFFDDSNRSDVDIALPSLADRGLTATFFVLAGRLGAPGHLGAADLRLLCDAGMTIGSHGMHHRNWRTLGDAELTEEIRGSRQILAATCGTPVGTASVPFGAYDRRVLSALRRDGGYTRVYTSDGGAAPAGAWLQPRTSVTVDDTAATVTATPAPAARARWALKRSVKRWR